MRAFPAPSESQYPFLLFPQPAPSLSSNPIPTTLSLSFFHPWPFHFKTHHHTLSTPKPCSFNNLTPFLYSASKSDPTALNIDNNDDDDDDDDEDNASEELLNVDDIIDDYVVEESESLAEDGVYIEVTKLDKNSCRIESRISVDASLDAVWRILTDYERLADFIPGLAVSQLLKKGDNYARLLQIGQQNLAFGIKFNAKGVVDCFEKELETLASGMRREIEFKMIEGDFQIFEGKWSILQQFNSGSCDESQVQEINTTLSYIVDVKPKLWLPVRLIEGRLCYEIKRNLASIMNEAQKAIDITLPAGQLE